MPKALTIANLLTQRKKKRKEKHSEKPKIFWVGRKKSGSVGDCKQTIVLGRIVPVFLIKIQNKIRSLNRACCIYISHLIYRIDANLCIHWNVLLLEMPYVHVFMYLVVL